MGGGQFEESRVRMLGDRSGKGGTDLKRHLLAQVMVNARVLCRRISLDDMVMRDERTAKERGVTR